MQRAGAKKLTLKKSTSNASNLEAMRARHSCLDCGGSVNSKRSAIAEEIKIESARKLKKSRSDEGQNLPERLAKIPSPTGRPALHYLLEFLE